ncbi:hypothetical protein [Brevibacillus daliensis]|nr:hypothetical protein [Brevibacillus daliensis]
MNLNITIDPVLQWASYVWQQIDILVYLLIGISVGFLIARGLLNIFR